MTSLPGRYLLGSGSALSLVSTCSSTVPSSKLVVVQPSTFPQAGGWTLDLRILFPHMASAIGLLEHVYQDVCLFFMS